nr:MAG TPA: hypothetical protein [Caudoviricetes sp.]
MLLACFYKVVLSTLVFDDRLDVNLLQAIFFIVRHGELLSILSHL